MQISIDWSAVAAVSSTTAALASLFTCWYAGRAFHASKTAALPTLTVSDLLQKSPPIWFSMTIELEQPAGEHWSIQEITIRSPQDALLDKCNLELDPDTGGRELRYIANQPARTFHPRIVRAQGRPGCALLELQVRLPEVPDQVKFSIVVGPDNHPRNTITKAITRTPIPLETKPIV